MFLHCLQWLKATVPKGIKCGFFCLGPAPFSCCFPWFEAKGKSGWGICGSSCFGCLFCFCVLDLPTFLILANCAEYLFFHRLCIYQDRATEHLRPNSRKKKNLARSSHIVVLMNELSICMIDVPPWGVKSGVRTNTKSEVLTGPKITKNKPKAKQQKQTQTKHKQTH